MFVPRERRGQRLGMTLLEVAISAGLLMIVMGAILGFYLLGLKLWSTNTTRSELLQAYQRTTRLLRRFVSESDPNGLSIENDCLSLINSRNDSGEILLSDQGRQVWQAWVLFYREDDTIKRSRYAWSADPADREVAAPLETATGLPLISAKVDDRLVAKNVESLSFNLEPDGLTLEVQLELQKRSRGKPNGERFRSSTIFRFRN